MNCIHCGELILAGEAPTGAPMLSNLHRECAVRVIAGSAAHQLGDCPCFGGEREDPPTMSKRDAARLAVEAWEVLNAPALEASQ
jgi:hypothetical protein